MRTRITRALSVALSFMLAGIASGAEPKTAIEAVSHFYKGYLSYLTRGTPDVKGPSMPMSKSFSQAVKKNAEICAANSTSICGWAADGDVYLDAQEIGPKLTFANTGIKFAELEPGLVRVQLNVYPSVKDADGAYDRTLIFKMVSEEGRWVMDDVVYADGISARKRMNDENADVMSHPDPDSPAGKPRKNGKNSHTQPVQGKASRL